MKLTTPVEIKPLERRLTYKDSIMFIGSCFADEMGRRCVDRYFDALVNPFGVLFNPCSISDCLGLLEGYGINAEQCSFIPEDVIETSGGFCSFHHHGSFCRPTAQEFLDNANRELARSSEFYYREGWVVVTLGTAFIYTDKESGMVVSNCHKLPEREFTRERLSVEQIVAAWRPLIRTMQGKHWVFTVSPIRHRRDTMHGNQLSKAVLLLAIEQLQQEFPEQVNYFPAYELLLDELRDYRFYADDLVHPSAAAVEYIWERLCDTYIAPATMAHMQQRHKEWLRAQHRQLIVNN